jgi:preprotein translocase subunit SecA
MDRQRHVIYGERREVLEGADLEQQMRGFIDDVIEGYVIGATEGFSEEWDVDALWTALKQLYPVSLDLKTLEDEVGGRANLTREVLLEDLKKDAQAAYDAREAEIGEENLRELERRVVLSVLDRRWRDHLYEMDYLREGIYLRAYSQRDPLVEYQREGFDMFTVMMDGIKEESVGFLFNLQVEIEDEAEAAQAEAEAAVAAEAEAVAAKAAQVRAKGLEPSKAPTKLSYSGPAEDGEATTGSVATESDEYAGVGRNADCPCGSGKKYKKCHGAPGGPTGLTTRVNG